MSKKKKKSNYVNLGAIMKSKDGGLYISLNEDVEIEIDGREVAESNGKRYINLAKPIEKYDRMLEGGHIDADTYNERIENIPEFVKYELSVKLD